MMKMKIFIAQKMTGLTDEQIEEKRNRIALACSRYYGDDIMVLDQFHLEYDVPDDITSDDGIGIYLLGRSLQILAEADLVVFDDDISTSKGSLVEEFVTKTYNIPTITYRELRDKTRDYVKKSMSIKPDDIAEWSTMLSPSQLFPKKIARISVCGALNFDINENAAFVKPTPEQIKNLHDTFCIDVELFDDNQEKSKMISKESLHHIMYEWIKPKLNECESSGGSCYYGSRNSGFDWGMYDNTGNRGYYLGASLCYDDNNVVIGYDIWSYDVAYVNIKIRVNSIEFIEDSEFRCFTKEEMKDLYDKIKSVLQEE